MKSMAEASGATATACTSHLLLRANSRTSNHGVTKMLDIQLKIIQTICIQGKESVPQMLTKDFNRDCNHQTTPLWTNVKKFLNSSIFLLQSSNGLEHREEIVSKETWQWSTKAILPQCTEGTFAQPWPEPRKSCLQAMKKKKQMRGYRQHYILQVHDCTLYCNSQLQLDQGALLFFTQPSLTLFLCNKIGEEYNGADNWENGTNLVTVWVGCTFSSQPMSITDSNSDNCPQGQVVYNVHVDVMTCHVLVLQSTAQAESWIELNIL